MITDKQEIYSKLNEISQAVKDKLKSKGIVVPVKTKEGKIRVGYYSIDKKDGFYVILDYADEIVIKNINLPQSAALLANKLALGKNIDREILEADQKYGHAVFEQTLQESLARKKLKSSDYEIASVLFNKAGMSKLKKEHYKSLILSGFEKLIKVR